MELIVNEDLELDVAVVAEIDKLEFKVVPVVKGKYKGVDFFVEVEPLQWGSSFLMLLT